MVSQQSIKYGTFNITQFELAMAFGVVDASLFFELLIQTKGPPDNLFRWIKKHETPTGWVGAISAFQINAGYLQWTASRLKEDGIDIEWQEFADEAAWRAEVESWST